MALTPFWVKSLASKLYHQDIVYAVEIRYNKMRVRYKTSTPVETYHFKPRRYEKIPMNVFFIREGEDVNDPLPLKFPYEFDPLDDVERHKLSYHFEIDRAEFHASSFMDQRLAVHRAIKYLCDNHRDFRHYPQNIIERDWATIKKIKLGKFIDGDAFNFYPRGVKRDQAWRRVFEHYFDIGRTEDAIGYWVALNFISRRRTVPINTAEVMKRVDWFRDRKIYNPVAYAAILKRFNPSKGVIDLYPGYGYKAIACALLGVKYITKPNARIDYALSKGIVKTIGLQYEPLEDQKASILLSDMNLTEFNIGEAKPYLDRVNTMIAFTKAEDRLLIQSEYNPGSFVRVYNTSKEAKSLRNPNYLVVW